MNLRTAIERSIRNKVMALVLGITALALILSAVALVIYDLQSYEQQATRDMQAQADVLARATAPALAFNDEKAAEKDLSVMQVRPKVIAAALYKPDGTLFATYMRPGANIPPFPARPLTEGYKVEGGQLSVFRRVVENGETVGTVHLRSLYEPWGRLADYLSLLAVVTVASLAIAALLSSWLQQAVTQPVQDIARVAGEVVEKRDYSLRVQKTTDDEVGQLVDAFNRMLAEIGRRADALKEADQRKDEFLATLAHELRNPLAPMRNALEIQRIAGADPEVARKAREMMERQMKQMVRLVDDLLDVSRITTGKLAVRRGPMDLVDAVNDALEIARPAIEARGQQLEVRLPRGPVPIDGDRTRLAQVFANLLNNAGKYTQSAGRIEIDVSADAAKATVRVRDNGSGLAPESLLKIFDMFVQVDRTLERSQAGLGVGLSLAKRLVELHGGHIEARSAGLGKGSEFEVRLPTSGGRLEPRLAPVNEAATVDSPRRILLADDNVDFAESLGQLLSSRGHDVRIAYDGAEALETAQRFRPQIAFVDIGMPKVHGYDVAKRLREQPMTAKCVLVAVTGWGQESDRKRAQEAGFDRHLTKPVDPREIESILSAY
jgi:two-component system, sensor histidine kinase